MEETKKEEVVIQNEEPKISFEQFKEQMHQDMQKTLNDFKVSVLGDIIKELNKDIKKEETKEEPKEKTINDYLF